MENEWYNAYQSDAVTEEVTVSIKASQRTDGGKAGIPDR